MGNETQPRLAKPSAEICAHSQTRDQNSGAALPATSWIIFWFGLMTVLGIWPALTNGQPFFFADTTAYVRGADLAVSKALGDRFATDWAKDPRRRIDPQTSALGSESSSDGKPVRRVVLAGRSIVYGALLYLGEVFGGMWFSVIIQALVATYLIFLFTVRVLRLNFRCFLISCVVLSCASQLPFFASFLMPDVFAGFLILAWAILATGWDRLNHLERAIVSAVILFAVLAHATHFMVLLCLTALTVAYVALVDRARWPKIRWLVAIAASCAAIAILWEAAFSFAVTRAFGSPPVRPPFVMAKLVSMLGEPAVAKVCASQVFVVCRFQDRFPLNDQLFLWSEDQRTGVFSVVDAQTKRALGDEQTRFALAIIRPNLGKYVAGISLDCLRQIIHIGLPEYFYDLPALQFFRDRLPSHHFEKLTSTLAARSDIYVVFGRTILNFTVIVAAIVTLLLLSGMFPRRSIPSATDLESHKIWRAATYMLLTGILLNAFICGGLSGVHNRYQARIAWLIPLAATVGIFVIKPRGKRRESSPHQSQRPLELARQA